MIVAAYVESERKAPGKKATFSRGVLSRGLQRYIEYKIRGRLSTTCVLGQGVQNTRARQNKRISTKPKRMQALIRSWSIAV